jgi:hypothetical protein
LSSIFATFIAQNSKLSENILRKNTAIFNQH